MLKNGTLILNEENIKSISYKEKKSAKRIIIKEGVRLLGIVQFADLPNLTKIVLPHTLIGIGPGCFRNCHNLRHINLPVGLKVIHPLTFNGCSSLTDIELPEHLEEIQQGAFFECRNLSHINLPGSIKKVTPMAFGGCRCIDKLIHDYPHLIEHYNISEYHWEHLIEIFKENPDVANFFALAYDCNGAQWMSLLTNVPELAYRCPWRRLSCPQWAELLAQQPQFADFCPWGKLTGSYLISMLEAQPQLATKCHWEKVYCQRGILAYLPHLAHYCNWEKINFRDFFRDYQINLSQFKLENVPSPEGWRQLLDEFYSDKYGCCKGLFADGVDDAATYMIYKSMDKDNAKLFIKKQFSDGNWDFLEDLCDISPEELTHSPGKRKMPFDIALNCPDRIFYKFFQSPKLAIRDKAGNSPLFPALVNDLLNGKLNRFEFLCQKGFDPNEKNLAGFSCNDMIKHYVNK